MLKLYAGLGVSIDVGMEVGMDVNVRFDSGYPWV